MLKEIIIFLLVAYIISRVLRFLLPIFRITSAANGHMRKMQEQMKQMQEKMNEQQQPNATQRKSTERKGDYIDYEEV